MVTPDALAGSVSVTDLSNDQVTTIPTGAVIPIAVGMTPDGSRAYVTKF